MNYQIDSLLLALLPHSEYRLLYLEIDLLTSVFPISAPAMVKAVDCLLDTFCSTKNCGELRFASIANVSFCKLKTRLPPSIFRSIIERITSLFQ